MPGGRGLTDTVRTKASQSPSPLRVRHHGAEEGAQAGPVRGQKGCRGGA